MYSSFRTGIVALLGCLTFTKTVALGTGGHIGYFIGVV
jgi:hypothetical protein